MHFISLLQRVVSQYEAKEHTLYSKAREAEGVRRKQVQLVEKLQEDLEHLKQRNAMKLKVSGYMWNTWKRIIIYIPVPVCTDVHSITYQLTYVQCFMIVL